MEQPLVSVITITRNRGSLLGRCINSVLGQTYKKIEYFIVDGASDDNTDEVVASFKDDRLHFIKLESNWPIKETLDQGISLCKGKYVTFLDSDDEYVPDKVEKQVRLIESLPNEYGFVYCWMSYYDNTTNMFLRKHAPTLRGFVPVEAVSSNVISGTPSLMFRREVLIDLEGWKSKDEIGIISDWELCARACQKYKVDFTNESLVNVYVNHGSVRQSQAEYYDEFYKRNIVFHKYFLQQYKDLFTQYPKAAQLHYQLLTVYSFRLKDRISALRYYRDFIKTSPSLVKAIRLLWGIIIAK